MNEIIKQFENKDCLVYTMNSQITGVISKIGEGWIEITGEKEKSVVNTDYIIRIREYPKDKRGKKKSVVLDWKMCGLTLAHTFLFAWHYMTIGITIVL